MSLTANNISIISSIDKNIINRKYLGKNNFLQISYLDVFSKFLDYSLLRTDNKEYQEKAHILTLKINTIKNSCGSICQSKDRIITPNPPKTDTIIIDD